MNALSREELLKLLKENESIREAIREVLVTEYATKTDIKQVLEEIKYLREDFNKQAAAIEHLREDFQTEIKKLREDFNKQATAIEHLREDFQTEIKKLREDFQTEIKNLHLKIDALGARWGIFSEKATIAALKGFFEKKFDLTIESWITYDQDGYVYGHPSEIEADIAVHNDEHWLIECKSSVKISDVGALNRKGQLYKKETENSPKLFIVTPFIREDAEKFAKRIDIQIFKPF